MHMASDDRRSGISSIINKMADNGIRLYEISDPRKSYAGHTVYRVSAKVCQEGFPGEIEEVVVWRRFSEFKKLQKDLSRLYNSRPGETDFPCLPKATFFDRFDEVVIEERRRGALNLLNFAGNIPRLAKSQYFRNFFEGGIYQRAACSRNSSRTSSLSSSDGDIPECHATDKEGQCATTQDTDEFQGCLELGGVWLCKQPSLVEGLDKTETAVDEAIYEQSTDGECQLSVVTPSFIRSLFDEDSEDVFGKEKFENDKEMSWDSDGEDDQERSRKTSTWLQRAISLCSEGDDIETLACEAENDEYVKELDFPKPFAELKKTEVKSQEENERSKYECNERNAESDCVGNSVFNVHQMVDTKKAIGIESKRETVTQDQKQIQSEYRENQRSKDEPCEACNLPKSISKHKDLGDSFISLKESQKKTKPFRFDPQDTNLLSDSTKDDYLFAAARVVRQALNFELDGQYKEAFYLYKKCVSLLLSGVQGEKDAKRRDAVRRKTAQYLLKAEALYTAYVHESKELPENASRRLNAIGEDSNYYQEAPSQLQLPNYSVIGVVGKVILVKNTENKNTYIIKVLPKIESSYHSCHKSKDVEGRKGLLKAAYAQSPFIVKLHQHSETPTAVLLLLEHARGGRLCDYLTPLKRRQQQQSSVTSKSQRFVQNLKQTEVNKGIPKACLSRNDKRENQKTKSLVTGSKEKEDSSGKSYPDTEPSAIHCQNKDDLKLRQENDRISLDKSHGGSIAGSAKLPKTFALLDDFFSWSSKTSIESYVRVWMAEIILALAHLHSNGIICRDLNPRNILISDEGHVLLTHFSVWEGVNEELDLFSLEEAYCAPELFKLEKVTSAADWWSVGALFYEILTGQALTKRYPWGIRSHTEIETANNLSAEASALIRELIKVSPSERLGSGVNGLEDIKSHPFFSGVDWSALKSRHCQS